MFKAKKAGGGYKNSKNKKKQKKSKQPKLLPPSQLVDVTAREIITEFEHKFPGFTDLNMKLENRLVQEMKQIISQRLESVMNEEPNTRENSFKLSGAYRRKHPHLGDFQFVLKIAHSIQDNMGVPREEINEAQFKTLNIKYKGDVNLPLDRISGVLQRYSDEAATKVAEHINNLDVFASNSDSQEMKARKKVRQELKTMTPFINMVMKEILVKKFSPVNLKLRKMRIYGEPFLPNKESMAPFLKKIQALLVKRSNLLYNLLLFSIPEKNLPKIMAEDGTQLCGAKLLIRPLSKSKLKMLRAQGRINPKYCSSDSDSDDNDDDDDEHGGNYDYDEDMDFE